MNIYIKISVRLYHFNVYIYIIIFKGCNYVVFEPTCFKVTVQTQQQCINIGILLWQHVSVLLDNLQASNQRYEVQSVHIMYCGIQYYLQGLFISIILIHFFILIFLYMTLGTKIVLTT
jgi:hypothetical protein